jgi:hypothetical protein
MPNLRVGLNKIFYIGVVQYGQDPFEIVSPTPNKISTKKTIVHHKKIPLWLSEIKK